MTNILNNPSKYMEELDKLGGDFNVLYANKLESAMRRFMSELEDAEAKNVPKLAEALDKLTKLWLLVTGRATSRSESMVHSEKEITVKSIMEKIEDDKELESLDYHILDVMEEEEESGDERAIEGS